MQLPQLLQLPPTHNRTFGLDLMRAFAIVTVMLAHGAVWVSPKFTFFYEYVVRFDGVSIFFVLSGFLIGGILIRTVETAPATPAALWNFWVKRWVRTVPPFFLALLIVLAIEHWHGYSIRPYVPYFFFVQNLNWPHPAHYSEAWSLAIEEWFYLLSAPAVFLLASFLRARWAVLVTAIAILALTTLHRYLHYLDLPPQTLVEWDDQFRKVVTMRLDALMYGVVAAYLAYYHQGAWLKYKWPLFGIGLVWLYLQKMPVQPGEWNAYGCVWYFSTTAVATAMMLPALSSWKSAEGSLPKVITHVSLVSYSIYLLHSTILNNAFILPWVKSLPIPQAAGNLLGLTLFWVVTLVAATLMYKYFEVPVMGLRNKLTTTPAKAAVPA